MSKLIVEYNNNKYEAKYNTQNGYYELELIAPNNGGIYDIDIIFTDQLENRFTDQKKVQILKKEPIKIITNKTFLYIFDGKDFHTKDIVEIDDYEISIDEETNSTSTCKVLYETQANAEDIVFIKKDNEIVYWGIIKQISNEDGTNSYEYTFKYITNIFDTKVELIDESVIKTIGIEDFVANTISREFIDNTDTLANFPYLKVNVKTHTLKNISVDNENKIFNLHTQMNNFTQKYNITYNFRFEEEYLIIDIENKEQQEELIDIKAQSISNYIEVFETSIVSKVKVLTTTKTYFLYLLNDRTTTTDKNNPNRVIGKTEVTYTEQYEDAYQKALDIIRSNSYNHNVSFKYKGKYLKIGTPVVLKTKKSIILNTYISAVKFTKDYFYEYTCGNIRIDLIDIMLKERNK